MAALQSRAFAAAGWTVLQIDLFGCGDSPGHFVEAHWQRWLDDVAHARDWLQRETGRPPALWGLRAGCLLTAQAARSLPAAPPMVLWQPTLSGRQHLQQFLRLKVGSHIVSQADSEPPAPQRLREQLAQGQTVEVTGYEISPALASGLEAAELDLRAEPANIVWLEVQRAPSPELAPASRTRIQKWQQSGHRVDARAVSGPAFWQTPEITECPALIEATLDAVRSWPS